MTEANVGRLYDRLCDFESRNAGEAYPVHKRLAFDEPGIADVYDWIIRRVPPAPGAVVLDAGCGVGFGTTRLARAADGVRALGITISEREVALAQRYNASGDAVRFEHGSFDTVPADRFDLIVAVESLKHSPEVETSLARLAAALRPGGTLVVVDDFYDGPAADRTARRLAANWHLPELHREQQYTRALGAGACESDDLTAHVNRQSALTHAVRDAGLAVASLLPGRPGRIARIFRGGIALDRLYARGTMRYLAIRYRKPAAPP